MLGSCVIGTTPAGIFRACGDASRLRVSRCRDGIDGCYLAAWSATGGGRVPVPVSAAQSAAGMHLYTKQRGSDCAGPVVHRL